MKNSGTDDSRLEQMRRAIDQIDKEILLKLNERASFAKKVGEIKQRLAGGEKVTFYRPEREANILREIINKNEGALPNEAVAQVFRQIISACRAHESPMRIAFLGPEGTFTQEAALKHFGSSVSSEPMETIDDVFSVVSSKKCDYGVVPIENSTEGVVGNTLDRFLKTKIKVCGEIKIKITHCFLTPFDSETPVEKIYAHQQALAQCRNWIKQHFEKVELIGMPSNAAGAIRAKNENGTAAIGPKVAANIYDLNIICSNIEDQSDNATRFLIVGNNNLPISGNDKTSILISASDTAGGVGVLYNLLKPLADYGVSMTRIESRPSKKKKWEYVFFIDLEGHANEPHITKALSKLKNNSSLFKILGAYPKTIY